LQLPSLVQKYLPGAPRGLTHLRGRIGAGEKKEHDEYGDGLPQAQQTRHNAPHDREDFLPTAEIVTRQFRTRYIKPI
jgi:hypothetical protein